MLNGKGDVLGITPGLDHAAGLQTQKQHLELCRIVDVYQLKGRIEAFPGEVMVTYTQIRDTFSQEDAALFTHHPKAINQDPMYLLLSKKVAGNGEMRDLFNEGLKRLKESGQYDQIIADALAGKYAKPK